MNKSKYLLIIKYIAGCNTMQELHLIYHSLPHYASTDLEANLWIIYRAKMESFYGATTPDYTKSK